MKISVLLNISLITTAGFLGAGYILAGYWIILPVLLFIILFWFIIRSKTVFWPASSILFINLLLSAVGIRIGLSLNLMILACTAALVSWDLMLFTQNTGTEATPDAIGSLEKCHLQSLAFAAIAGMMLAFISSMINLHLPFFIILILVLLTMAGLAYGIQFIKKIDQ